MSSDAQRDTVEVLKAISREMKEVTKAFQESNRNLARALHPSWQPSLQIPPSQEEASLPVTLDWENEPIKGRATVVKGYLGTKIEIWIDKEDRERANRLIDEGFVEALVVSSMVK